MAKTEDLEERTHALSYAAICVSATLSTLASSQESLDHEDLPDVLHMLACVLQNPEILT